MMRRIHSSPFVCPFFAGLLLFLAGCATPPVRITDGPLSLGEPTPELSTDPIPLADALAWFSVGLLREMEQEYPEALDAYQRAILSDPDNDALYMLASRRLIAAGRTDDAFALLNRLLERDPDSVTALRWLARLHLQAEEAEPALALYRRALESRPAEERVYLEAMQAALKAEQEDLAREFARLATEHAEQPVKATELYVRLLRRERAGAEDLRTIAELQDEEDAQLDRALTRFPGEETFAFFKAEREWARKHPDGVFKVYRNLDAHAVDRDETRARILVNAIQSLGGGRVGAKELREVLEAREQDSLAAYLDGLLWEIQGEAERARKAYERAVALDPDDRAAIRKLAILAYQTGTPRRSLELITRVLERDPDDADLVLLAGQIALTTEQYPRAATLLRRRLLLDAQGRALDDKPFVQAQLAVALLGSGGDRGEAADLLERAASEPGNLEMAWRSEARRILKVREDDPERAAVMESELGTLLRDLSDRLPRNPEIEWMIASYHNFRKDYARSLAALHQVRERAQATGSPESWLNQEYYFDLAAAQERNGEWDASVKTFLELIENHPDHAPSLNYVAYMWAEKGVNLEQALDFVLKALRLDPDNGSFIDTLGWVHYQMEDYHQAYQELSRAAELIPDESVVAEHLGDVLMKLDRPVEARGYYRIALDLDPGERRDIVEASLEQAEAAVAASLSASAEEP